MPFKQYTPIFTNLVTTDIYQDSCIEGLVQKVIANCYKEIEKKKVQVIKDCLSEIGIEPEEDATDDQIFKFVTVMHKGKEETFYFNSGAEEGFRIVTFVQEAVQTKPAGDAMKVSVSLSYY